MNEKNKYPRLLSFLLKKIIPFSDRDHVVGSFEVDYCEKVKDKGKIYAYLWGLLQILLSVNDLMDLNIHGSYAMFKNYIKIAFRNLLRHKGFSIINISGLSAGLTCCIFIYLYVQNETSYDTYHKDADRLHRITVALTYPTGLRHFAGTSAMLASYSRENFPQVEYVAMLRTFEEDYQVRYRDRIFKENKSKIITIEEDIFNILTIPLKLGDHATALSRPNTVVISEETAEKYFGDEDPFGKILHIGYRDYEITGITDELPGNSFFDFNILISWSSLPEEEVNSPWSRAWFGSYPITFVKLAHGVDPDEFGELCSETVYDNAKETLDSRNAEYKCVLQPVTDIHLHSDFIWDIFPHSNVIYIYIFSGIGIFIFFIACINFMNLSTARSGNRACEVGMRKVAGAQKRQLLMQFVGESVLITFISFL
ncbi:MAG: hypothetical protein GY863_22460, partial [bacterium]|nr:hypothetical protein [bacterium]